MKPLTEQEIRIVNLMIRSMGFDAIAAKLHIEHSTLRVHTSNIRQKLGVTTTNRHNLENALARYRKAAHPIAGAALSAGEKAVAELRAQGKTFREICQIRGCALSTALNLSSRACRKLGVKGSTNPTRILAALAAADTEHPLVAVYTGGQTLTMEDF